MTYNHMCKIKSTLVALAHLYGSVVCLASTTISGVAKLTNESPLIATVTSHTFKGLTVTKGETTITYDLTLTGNFRIVDTVTPHVLTINSIDTNVALSVSNISDDNLTTSFTFDGFTSIHGYHNLDGGIGTFDMIHDGGTLSLTPPLGSGVHSGTTDKAGVIATFEASSNLSLVLTSKGSGNFVRFDEVGVSFTGASERLPAALLGFGELSLVLKRRN